MFIVESLSLIEDTKSLGTLSVTTKGQSLLLEPNKLKCPYSRREFSAILVQTFFLATRTQHHRLLSPSPQPSQELLILAAFSCEFLVSVLLISGIRRALR